jgi:hypothetical protein
MLRFTIRDLLWLMVVVGIIVSWRLHILALSHHTAVTIAEERRNGEIRTKEAIDRMIGRYTKPRPGEVSKRLRTFFEEEQATPLGHLPTASHSTTTSPPAPK